MTVSGRQDPATAPAGLVLQSPAMPNSKRAGDEESQYLLRKHRMHAGLYARIASKLSLSPSYVSRIAKGERTSERILKAIIAELKRIEGR